MQVAPQKCVELAYVHQTRVAGMYGRQGTNETEFVRITPWIPENKLFENTKNKNNTHATRGFRTRAQQCFERGFISF